jgi:hypothetical protein
MGRLGSGLKGEGILADEEAVSTSFAAASYNPRKTLSA